MLTSQWIIKANTTKPITISRMNHEAVMMAASKTHKARPSMERIMRVEIGMILSPNYQINLSKVLGCDPTSMR